MGVEVADVPADVAQRMGIDSGVLVSKVAPEGAAAKAGIREGDVILSLDRKEVGSVEELEAVVEDAPADQALPVLVQRDQAPTFLAMTLPSGKG